jgi:hypothetical protein
MEVFAELRKGMTLHVVSTLTAFSISCSFLDQKSIYNNVVPASWSVLIIDRHGHVCRRTLGARLGRVLGTHSPKKSFPDQKLVDKLLMR